MNEENGHQNGQGNGPARVKFGPKSHQTIPQEWAEAILSSWAQAKPKEFGKFLSDVVLAELDRPQ